MRLHAAALALPLALALASSGAAGQDLDSLRGVWTIPVPTVATPVVASAGISPATASGSPTAFGAAWRDVFMGAGYQARTRYLTRDDGAVVLGFGVGNAREGAGLEVAVTSASTWDSGFFRRTYLSFKLHRLLPGNWAAALGYEHAVILDLMDPSEGQPPDGGQSLYAVVSRVWSLAGATPFRSLSASLGVGGGRFRSEAQVLAREGTAGVFGALALQVAQPVSVIADWTGQDLALGLSIVPSRRFPLIVTPALADVTGTAGDGARFILGVGAGWHLARSGGTR